MLLEEHTQTFGVSKPVIGCLHMMPLPGTYYADASIEIKDQIKRLKQEANILQGSGFDAVVFANEGDRPYLNSVGPEIVACYTRIATEVVETLTIPYGCGVLIDPFATLAVAKAIDAKFVRTYVSNTYVGLFGAQDFCPGEIFRYQKKIGAETVKVYTYFEAHAGTCLDTRSVESMVDTGTMNLPIAGMLLGGPRAGLPPEVSTLAAVKKRFPEVPVLVGSGSTAMSIASLLAIADGAIVGTSIKRDGILWNPVDAARAEALIKAAKG